MRLLRLVLFFRALRAGATVKLQLIADRKSGLAAQHGNQSHMQIRPFLVYGLFTRSPDGKKLHFYIGKTERTVDIRVREHIGKTGRGHEDMKGPIGMTCTVGKRASSFLNLWLIASCVRRV